MATFAFTSDLHLTDRERDEYRWDFFPWFRKACEQRKAKAAFILGDLTDRKDHHSSRLVNRTVIELKLLAEICPVWILKGNHDYLDPRLPFFRFLSELALPRLHYIWRPRCADICGKRVWLLPHTRKPQEDWSKHNKEWRTRTDLILIHQSVVGAELANGTQMMDGLTARYFIECGVLSANTQIISGDIHLPQKVGKVIYVGSPYRVDFGDKFIPRVLFWKDRAFESLVTPMARRSTVEITCADDLDEAAAEAGDQIKVRLKLARTDLADWKDIREDILRRAAKRKLEVFGVDMVLKEEERPKLKGDPYTGVQEMNSRSPAALLSSFCKIRGVDPILVRIGQEILAQGGE